MFDQTRKPNVRTSVHIFTPRLSLVSKSCPLGDLFANCQLEMSSILARPRHTMQLGQRTLADEPEYGVT